MTQLSKNTKQARNFMKAWDYSSIEFLSGCYKSYSYEKARAFNYCKEVQKQYNGEMGFIISYNSNYFTFGFISYIDDEVFDLHIITYANHYIIKNLKMTDF